MRKRALSLSWLTRFLGRLRFPYLFGLSALLFGVNLFVPDAIPFADEILMALATATLGAWKRRREESGSSHSSETLPED